MDESSNYLDAKASDPVNFGWMQGFPPPKECILSAVDGSFFKFPALRYSVCHMRQFFPTAVVPAATEKRHEFSEQLDPNIDALTFQPLDGSAEMTWADSLYKNYTDGIVILHRGKLVYERYFAALKPNHVHAAMSVSKTFAGTLGATLVAEGVLDAQQTCAHYIPELKGSGFADATVHQVLDMTTALKYSEDYANPKAEIWTYSAAGNPFPKPADYHGPQDYCQALQGIQKSGEHGKSFGYRTPNADMIGWLISRVLNQPLPQVLSERIWQPLGCHIDAYYQLDSVGMAFAGGGFNANIRDMARFGEMIRCKGAFNGKQILPASVSEDIEQNGDPELFARDPEHQSLKGWSYRNMWWKTNNEHGAFAARGVYGQTIYIDPVAEMVIVRFASYPIAANAANDAHSLPAYHAVARYLKSK
ncbi:beta-lactamase family protein [Cardiobacteriaceae bacterium TAE3-ERU3]|nr:beta-lactamase family protein [Cardiobacteriaceae bacterium TAE3-ERU3]